MIQSRLGLVSLLVSQNSSVVERSYQVESLESVAMDVNRPLPSGTISQMALWQRSVLKILVRSHGEFVVNSPLQMSIADEFPYKDTSL